MWKKLSWNLIQPIVMKAVRLAVGRVDGMIDTPAEREALAERILSERHDQIKAALVKALERGHDTMEARGF